MDVKCRRQFDNPVFILYMAMSSFMTLLLSNFIVCDGVFGAHTLRPDSNTHTIDMPETHKPGSVPGPARLW